MVQLEPRLLDKLDRACKQLGASRSAMVSIALGNFLRGKGQYSEQHPGVDLPRPKHLNGSSPKE